MLKVTWHSRKSPSRWSLFPNRTLTDLDGEKKATLHRNSSFMLLSGPRGRCPHCAPRSSANTEALLLDPPTIAPLLVLHHLWGLTVPREGTGPCVGTRRLSTRLYCLLWHSGTRATIPSLCTRVLPVLLLHSPRGRQASATPLICLRHSARRSDWTPVPGLFLVNLYGSPGLGLNVPSHQHVHKKTGRNEIPAPRKRPHASYANNGRQLRGHFPTLLTTLRQTNEKGGVLERP